MIMIKEQWYDVRDLDDVIKLVREEFNYDLADKIEELVDSERLDYESEISDLEDEINSINEECDNLKNEIDLYESACLKKDERLEILEDEKDELIEEIRDLQ